MPNQCSCDKEWQNMLFFPAHNCPILVARGPAIQLCFVLVFIIKRGEKVVAFRSNAQGATCYSG